MRKFRLALLAVLVGILSAGLVGELAARVWLRNLADPMQVALYGTVTQVEGLNSRFSQHHYLPFIPKPGYESGGNRHNALGFRGEEIAIPKPAGTYRVALLGGSTTYNTAVRDYQRSYPYVLQQILRTERPGLEVVNAGCDKYSTWESLLNLEFRVLDTEPDLVIVYHGINDVHPRMVYPYEAYKGDNSGSRTPYARPQEGIWDRSAVFRVLRARLGIRQPVVGLLYTRTHDYLATNHTMGFRNQKARGEYPSGVFVEQSASEMLEQNKPTYFERNLRNMIAVCRAHKIPVVLMTFAWSPAFRNQPLVASEEYQNAFREQNGIIKRLCIEEGVPYYDFCEEMPQNPTLWTDGRHVNELGAQVKAALVAQYLIQNRLINGS
ncbi:MAG: hypothetical protein JW937_06535 [Candidatus Omnitrophica bacterium]|nr:hypothetical protein [Candidatus Omnitrophota bacterium]